MLDMLDRYLSNLDKVRISTLDAMCRSVSAGHGGNLHLRRLPGRLPGGRAGRLDLSLPAFCRHARVRPGQCPRLPLTGSLGRFAGVAHVQGVPGAHRRGVWRLRLSESVPRGCPYNALAANGGAFDGKRRDPHCAAYKHIFDGIADRALQEVFSAENLAEVVNGGDPDKGLLRRGKLLSIMRDGPHPYETAQHARQIVSAVALAATGSPAAATHTLQEVGVITHAERGEQVLRALHTRLTAPVSGLNNLYLHVTFACPLRCTHCYAQAGQTSKGALAVEQVGRACREAAALGFRHAVITGGEPLAHPHPEALLDALAGLRREVKPMLTVFTHQPGPAVGCRTTAPHCLQHG